MVLLEHRVIEPDSRQSNPRGFAHCIGKSFVSVPDIFTCIIMLSAVLHFSQNVLLSQAM